MNKILFAVSYTHLSEYWKIRLGHFIGQEDHEYGDVSPINKNVAEPGMIFSIEPGIYIEGKYGVRIEDLVLVTEDGHELSLIHIYITPTMKEVDELMEVKPEIIAVDATGALRPGNVTLDDFFHQIKEKYPDQLLMADCSTVEEALHADKLGFDFIGTTMVGYTEQSQGDKIEENDFEILRKIVAEAKHKVIAEGNINTDVYKRQVQVEQT